MIDGAAGYLVSLLALAGLFPALETRWPRPFALVPPIVWSYLATTALALAGLLSGIVTAPPGVRALGAVADPVPFLTELATRGVRAAAFDGVLPSA